MTTGKIKLGKAPLYLKILKFGLLCTAGCLMLINTHYTIQGLLQYPNIPDIYGVGIGACLFVIEAAVTASIFSGSFQRTIISIFDDDPSNDMLSGMAQKARFTFIFGGIIVGVSITVFLFVFDYISTYDGLFGAGTPSNLGMIALTLMLNYGNEICSFVFPIIEHQHREARISQAENRMDTEPRAIYKEHQLRLAIAEARKATQLNTQNSQPIQDPFAPPKP